MECKGCKGTGQKLARLTREQDFALAQRGAVIPKVECWYCGGTGVVSALASVPSALEQGGISDRLSNFDEWGDRIRDRS